MNSLCWFCAVLDWKGISCKYFRFTHGSLYCIFVPLKVYVLVMLLSARTLLSRWFHVLEEDWETARLNYAPKTWEIYGEAEMWSPLLISTGLFISCLMPIPIWFGMPMPQEMCVALPLFCKRLKYLKWSWLTSMTLQKYGILDTYRGSQQISITLCCQNSSCSKTFSVFRLQVLPWHRNTTGKGGWAVTCRMTAVVVFPINLQGSQQCSPI